MDIWTSVKGLGQWSPTVTLELFVTTGIRRGFTRLTGGRQTWSVAVGVVAWLVFVAVCGGVWLLVLFTQATSFVSETPFFTANWYATSNAWPNVSTISTAICCSHTTNLSYNTYILAWTCLFLSKMTQNNEKIKTEYTVKHLIFVCT